ncbi:MAG: hypothetical protein R3C59_19050 [Planctomycetaceae bacterium]
MHENTAFEGDSAKVVRSQQQTVVIGWVFSEPVARCGCPKNDQSGLSWRHHLHPADERNVLLHGDADGSVFQTDRRLESDDNMTEQLVLKALRSAIKERQPDTGLLHHMIEAASTSRQRIPVTSSSSRRPAKHESCGQLL